MKITLLSSKGQITIPRELQKALNIAPRSKIALYPQKRILILKPLKTSIVEQTAGSLTRLIPKDKLGISYQKILEQTKKITAHKLAQKS